MFVKDGGFPAVNGVGFVEGNFTCAPGDYSSISIEMLMVYLNHPTGMTFGSCPVKGELLSEDTREKFRAFLLSAEEDFGNFIKESKGPPSKVEGTGGDLDAFKEKPVKRFTPVRKGGSDGST
jgi:hypothetical protein